MEEGSGLQSLSSKVVCPLMHLFYLRVRSRVVGTRFGLVVSKMFERVRAAVHRTRRCNWFAVVSWAGLNVGELNGLILYTNAPFHDAHN